jgi:hypothetical protein
MWIGISIVVIAVAAILAYAASKPPEFRVERTRVIPAPPEKVIALIEDFREWMKWSPYEKKDPNSQRTYSGAQRGAGAVYAWDGNRDIGAGRMEILEATPRLFRIKLDFLKPMEAHSTAEFTLEPVAGGTRVTWAMIGNMNYVCKVITVFMDSDKMCGPDFEKGLSAMEAVVTAKDSAEANLVAAH